MKKRCSKCKRLLPLDRFSKKAGTPDGLQYICRECRSVKQKKRCPECGWKNNIKACECDKCKLPLHTHYDCEGCAELDTNGMCQVFYKRNDPILTDDGQCAGYKEEPFVCSYGV